jgi:hypothetical protein
LKEDIINIYQIQSVEKHLRSNPQPALDKFSSMASLDTKISPDINSNLHVVRGNPAGDNP